MSERDLLREAFAKHETQTPDPAEVYAQVQHLAKGYKLRRWGAQAAGGAVLGAGLIAGAIQIPQMFPGPTANGVDVMPGAAAPASSAPAGLDAKRPAEAPSVPPLTPAEAALQKQWDAYFGAGYHYDDAVKLKKLWKSKDDIGYVKAKAGKMLLDGKKLPFKPLPYVEPSYEAPDPKITQQLDAYFAAGYDWNDAVKLAKIWKLDDPSDAKVLGGKKLLAGQKLPIKP